MDEEKFATIMIEASKAFTDIMKEHGVTKDNEFIYIAAGIARWQMDVLHKSYPKGRSRPLPDLYKLFIDTFIAVSPMTDVGKGDNNV